MAECPARAELPAEWYVPLHYAIGILTIPLILYAYYILYNVHIAHMDKQYKRYMYIFTTAIAACSLFNTFCINYGYMPAMIYVSFGFLSIGPMYDSSIETFIQSFSVAMGSVLALHRMYICMYGQSIPKLAHILLLIYLVLSISFYPISATLISAEYDEEDATSQLISVCPEFVSLMGQYKLAYIPSSDILYTTLVLMLSTCIVLTLTSLLFLAFSVYYLNKNSLNLSNRTKKMQFRLLLNLLVQILVPTILHIVPGIIYSYIFFFNIVAPRGILYFTFSGASLDGIVSVTCLLFLHKPYKAKVKQDFGIIFKNNTIFSTTGSRS